MDIVEHFKAGGLGMYPILVLLIITIVITVERSLTILRLQGRRG